MPMSILLKEILACKYLPKHRNNLLKNDFKLFVIKEIYLNFKHFHTLLLFNIICLCIMVAPFQYFLEERVSG